MAEKTIMLVCAGGMSSSLLVKHMQDAAADAHLHYRIFATGVQSAPDKYAKFHPAVVLVGPQVRFVIDRFRVAMPDVPVQMINMHSYGVMDGPVVLRTARELMGDVPAAEN